MSRKITTDEFISKAKKNHSDKYDYSLVEYINSHIKVKIICPNHGIFEQLPSDHFRFGCSLCSQQNNSKISANKKRTNIQDFIEKCNIIHNNEYDYSLVNYINTNTKIEIICKKHGSFYQTPY
jgi:hypothetical protein